MSLDLEGKSSHSNNGTTTNLCRVCHMESNHCLHLYQPHQMMPDGEMNTLAQVLSYCSGLEVLEEDFFLPDHMCPSCVHTLKMVYLFKHTVLKTDELLRQRHKDLCQEQETENSPAPELEDLEDYVYVLKEQVIEKSTQVIVECIDDAPRPRHPPKPNPTLQCQICRKQLSTSNSFKYHMQLHGDAKPFVCQICGESFKTRNAYDGHLTLHNPNNPNKCKICGKTYRQASSLRSHMMATHSGGIKPFRCDLCGKGLTQKSGYKKHLLTHTGEKPHECTECGRRFRYSSNLIAHKRCHGPKEKHLPCDICHKRTFGSQTELNRHKMSHARVKLGKGKCKNNGQLNTSKHEVKEKK